jgi:hypothetical protein
MFDFICWQKGDRSVALKKKRSAYTESIRVFGFCLFYSICVFKAKMANLAINPPIVSTQDAVALHELLKFSLENKPRNPY